MDKQASPKRQAKEAIVERLSQALEQATTVVLADYRGLNTTQLNALRAKLAAADATLTVIKNTLLKRALERRGSTPTRQPIDTIGLLTGPTALITGKSDEGAPLKALVQFARQYQLPKLKGGFVNRAFLSSSRLEQLASLPSKEELISQVVRGVGAPLYGMIIVLQANLRNAVYMLRQVQKQKTA